MSRRTVFNVECECILRRNRVQGIDVLAQAPLQPPASYFYLYVGPKDGWKADGYEWNQNGRWQPVRTNKREAPTLCRLTFTCKRDFEFKRWSTKLFDEREQDAVLVHYLGKTPASHAAPIPTTVSAPVVAATEDREHYSRTEKTRSKSWLGEMTRSDPIPMAPTSRHGFVPCTPFSWHESPRSALPLSPTHVCVDHLASPPPPSFVHGSWPSPSMRTPLPPLDLAETEKSVEKDEKEEKHDLASVATASGMEMEDLHAPPPPPDCRHPAPRRLQSEAINVPAPSTSSSDSSSPAIVPMEAEAVMGVSPLQGSFLCHSYDSRTGARSAFNAVMRPAGGAFHHVVGSL